MSRSASCTAAKDMAPPEKTAPTLVATPSIRASPLPMIVLGLLVLYTLYCLRAVHTSLLRLHSRLDTLEETLVAQASATCPTELVDPSWPMYPSTVVTVCVGAQCPSRARGHRPPLVAFGT